MAGDKASFTTNKMASKFLNELKTVSTMMLIVQYHYPLLLFSYIIIATAEKIPFFTKSQGYILRVISKYFIASR